MDQADVAGREGELHGIELHLVQRAVQGAHGPIDAELRLPLAQEHVAKDRRAVAAEHAGLLQRGPLPLRGHFVEGNVYPPAFVFAQFVRQAIDGDGNRVLATLADHAAIGYLGAILVRRKDHWAADVQTGPWQGPAGATNQLDNGPPAQAGILIRHHQVDQAVARLLRVGRRELFCLLGHALGLGPAFQIQEPGETAEMVLRPGNGRTVSGDPHPYAPIAEHLAIEGLEQPGLPAVGHLDNRGRAAKLDPADPLAIEPADAIEEVQYVGLADATGQGLKVEKRHRQDCTP